MENTVLEYLIKHSHDFVLKQELFWFATATISALSIVIGTIVAIVQIFFFRSIKGMIAEKENEIMEKVVEQINKHKNETDEAKEQLQNEAKEIRDNYLTRFDEIKDEIHKVQNDVIEIKTSLKYLVRKENER